MATYRGQINLINVNDGTASEESVGIAAVRTYYITSTQGSVPPDDELYTLVSESGLLDLSQSSGANLYFKNGVLLAERNGQELNLIIEDSTIIDAGIGWTEIIPDVAPGQYLWTKEVTSYTDGTAHVVYRVSRIGADGTDGADGVDGSPGAPGADSLNFILGNYADNIACDQNGLVMEDVLITIPFTAFQGTKRLACTIAVNSTLPDGVTISSNTPGTATTEGSLILQFAMSSSLGGLANGIIDLTITATDLWVTSSQVFSWSKAVQGEGADAIVEIYSIKTNQDEILKFTVGENNSTVTYSPQVLTASIYKQDKNLQNGEEQVTEELSVDNFNLQAFTSYGEWITVSSATKAQFVTLSETSVFQIDLNSLQNLANLSGEDSEFQILIQNSETTLRLSYVYSKTTGAGTWTYPMDNYVSIRFAMNKDMASLSLKANGIVLAMQDSKMLFDANGLTVQNGAFFIKDSQGNNLLYADENGNLSLIGNIYANDGYFAGELRSASGTFSGALEAATGTFSGALEAATGTFAGNISAATGTIGGYIISETQLTSVANGENGAPLIVLNGTDGSITAENIMLGTGAVIRDYITIGPNVQLKNAVSATDSFIQVTDGTNEILGLKANGVLNVGYGENQIILNGAEGSITSQNYVNGLGWKISNTESVFNDVVVRGSIKASVLEYGVVQAIGGMLIVRPSSRIVATESLDSSTKLTLESTIGFNIGDWCRIDSEVIHNYYQILSVKGNIVEVSGILADVVSYPIVNFGHDSDNIGIGINGSIDNSLITPQSISVFEFNQNTKTLVPRIVLGKLPDEPIYGFAKNTYGLYAENVLLKGSLVTQTDTSSGATYSGISTLYTGDNSPTSDQYKNWFGENNTGEILIWAGAASTSKEDVENSRFFVDRNGNLFAGSGYFRGTIITDATITASQIETAVLRGAGDSPALTIEDATKGIVFNAAEKTIFEVTNSQITAAVPSLIFNDGFKIKEYGNLVVPNLYVVGSDAGIATTSDESGIVPAIMLDKHRISYTENFQENLLAGVAKSYIDFQTGLSFSPDGSLVAMNLTESEVRAEVDLYINQTVKYNEIMEYRPVYEGGALIGYDLYVG